MVFKIGESVITVDGIGKVANEPLDGKLFVVLKETGEIREYIEEGLSLDPVYHINEIG